MTQPSTTYNFVSEYFDPKSGKTGTRLWSSFANKAEADSSNLRSQPGYRIIAEGISEDEARDLLALTPEICILTATVEDIFTGPNKDTVEVEWVNILHVAHTKINENRQRRQVNRLTMPPGNLNVIDDVAEESLKNVLYRAMMEDLIYADAKGDLVDLKGSFIKLANVINSTPLAKKLSWLN